MLITNDHVMLSMWKLWKFLEIDVYSWHKKNSAQKWPFFPVSRILDRAKIKILAPPPLLAILTEY